MPFSIGARGAMLACLLSAAMAAPAASRQKTSEPPAAAWPAPELTEKTFKRWVQFIAPDEKERLYRRIGWRHDFEKAVAEAKALQRPILLWSDQGHPLGGDFYPSINTVISRATVFNDPEIQKLARHFVPATAEVWGLATGKGPASDFFRKGGGHRNPGGAHGLYLIGPGGEPMGFKFIARPKAPVLELMKKALEDWKRLAKEKGYQPKPVPMPESIEQAWPELAAQPGVQLVAYSRDLPRGRERHPGRDASEQLRWNRVGLHLSPQEMAGLLPRGGESRVPDAVVKKIALRCLGDGAKGNFRWRTGERAIRSAVMSAQKIAGGNGRVTVRYRGRVTLEEGTPKYDAAAHGRRPAIAGDHRWDEEGLIGFDCELFGEAVFSQSAKRFVHFELAAVGQRLGGRPKHDPGPAPLGVALVIEGQDAKKAPAAKERKARRVFTLPPGFKP